MNYSILMNTKEIDGALPYRFQLFPYGAVRIEGMEDAINDDEAMDIVIADFEHRGNDMVIDYEHQTLAGVQAPAAGWVKKLINKGKNGLWAAVEWTERAKEYLTKKEYRYFSPVFWVRNADHRIIKVKNVALTNDPRINNLMPIIAKLGLSISLDSLTLEIAKSFGNTEADIIEYGHEHTDKKQKLSQYGENILRIAKMFGNSQEDILKYSK